MLLDELVARTSLVDERGLLFELALGVHDIRSHEVSELELSEEFRVFEAKQILELFFGNSIKDIFERLLVSVADQLIDEGALSLVAPQANEEQLGVLHLLDIGAVLDDLVLVRLGYTGHTTEDTGKLADSEDVMEFGGGG